MIAGYPGRVRSRPTLQWVPSPDVLTLEPGTSDLRPVAEMVAGGGVVVLSGAGISTESGIPDYRGESGSLRTHTPMTYGDFVASESGRQRYWARSHLGWRTIARAAPNDGHRAVATLQARGYLSGVITQNVDGLHQAAGARDVIELHGNLDRVICLNCRTTFAREALACRLRLANAEFEGEATRINPDGDVELPDAVVQTFHVVSCEACTTGVLKPDVVFFGENVPKPRVTLLPTDRRRRGGACPRLVPHGDVRLPVRPPRRQGRQARADHQSGRHPRRPVRRPPRQPPARAGARGPHRTTRLNTTGPGHVEVARPGVRRTALERVSVARWSAGGADTQ